MRRVKRWALGLLAGGLLLAGAAWVWRAPLAIALAARVAPARLAADAQAGLPDGLHVGLCGAGSPFPDERRSGPCTVVVAGRRLFVFDAGGGSTRNLARMGFLHGRIDAIVLTHFHSDHIDGLGELMLQRWVAGPNAAPVPVWGPPGVEAVVAGFNQAYAPDRQYRVAHHGEPTMPSSGAGGVAQVVTLGADGRGTVWREGDLEITAFAVDHAPVHPALGYRIRYKDRSVVLSGDTRKSAAVQREATGADLLVHEALSPRLVGLLGEAAPGAGRPHLRKVFADIVDYHSTPEEAAQTAQAAGVRLLLLNHIAPPLPLPGLEAAFLGDAARHYAGPIRVGADGDFVSLPAGSTDVRVGRRF